MSNAIKMSDVFLLPMLCEKGDAYIYSKDCRHSIRFDDSDTNCMEQKLAVSNAINSHDDQAAQIAQLKADNKLLREYMLFIAKETDNETLSLAGVNEAANQALAATEIK
jgi:hypothetical protein